MVTKKSLRRLVILITTVMCVLTMVDFSAIDAYAASKSINIDGNIYEFDKNNDYAFSDAKPSAGSTYGVFSISGNPVSGKTSGRVDSFSVPSKESVRFSYKFDDSLLSDQDDAWHLVEEKSKKVDGSKLESDILNGAIIVQISKDNEKWLTVQETENTFAENAAVTDFYETTEIQALNGCYYRILVVYKLAKKTNPTQVFGHTVKENYEYKRIAEVYQFYLYDKDNYVGASLDNVEKVKLGTRERTSDEGYTNGTSSLENDDPHYGWQLGQFFVSGFTSKNTIDGKQYVLKNVGDVVTLGFYLKEDIGCLNGNTKLSIADDKKGYDKYFETGTTDFGRGTLIIRYTNPDGETSDPQIYTNYLEANISAGANTAVRLCEEGDYEVALDYMIRDDSKLINKETCYRIYFEFSVRNSNCMVYTFDAKTGSELTNGSVTSDGFYIDLANSQYLNVTVKKEILTDGADGLTEDIRFNRAAKDGENYTDEGIYTITVKNKAADLKAEKKIYVGDNKILRAYMVNNLSIAEIQDKVSEGAIIEDDGTIIEAGGKKIVQDTVIEEPTPKPDTNAVEQDDTPVEEELPEETKTASFNSSWIVAIVVAVVVIAFVILTARKKKNKVVDLKTSENIDKKEDIEENTEDDALNNETAENLADTKEDEQ